MIFILHLRKKKVELASFGPCYAYKVIFLVFKSFYQEDEKFANFDRKEIIGNEF